jgi:hypothetical protein
VARDGTQLGPPPGGQQGPTPPKAPCLRALSALGQAIDTQLTAATSLSFFLSALIFVLTPKQLFIS